MDARPATDNPLGLNLDFLHGRGYLWTHAENVSNWVTLKNLRMEIPDLSFPFDVRGGLSRFRDTRCLIREIDLEVSEVGVADLVRRATSDVEGFTDVEVRFLDGAVLFGARVDAFGVDSFMTFRLAALPADEETTTVRLLAHDFRAYGPLPCPVMHLGHTLLRRLLHGVAVETSFAPSLDGDTVEVRPLKLLLLHLFGRRGWKLPNVSSVDMSELILRPGAARLSARSDEEAWARETSTGEMANGQLAAALAADEARTLFTDGDAAAFAGRPEQALRTYQSFQDRYRLHPGLASRLLDVLLATPNAANLSEARSLCSDLQERDGDSLVAALGRARIAEIEEDAEEVIRAYGRLIALLEARGDTLDRAYCTVIAARSVAAAKPDEAIAWLAGVLRVAPRNLAALRELQKIYEATGRWADLEDILKRLTGVEQDRDSLVKTYLSLARHLMNEQGEVAEARTFLERARRIAPDDFEVLDALSEAWVMSGDPARGIKTLGDAAKAAKAQGDTATASRLLFRTAQLWNDALDNVDQALMQVRQAIEQWDGGEVTEPLELARQLRYAARLCNLDGEQGEAIAYWTEAIASLQLAEAHAEGERRVEARRALAATHRDIAAAYRASGRHEVAANHERRLAELDGFDDEPEVAAPVAAFRREFERARREPPPLPRIEELSTDSSLARVLERARLGHSSRDSSPEEATADAEASTSADSTSTEDLQRNVTAARKSQNAAELADALEALLDVADLTDERRAELVYELSETLYYELEESDRALDWLLEVRELDPSGYGARPGVLNAIEAIYEERGSIDGRIEILSTRLERSESPEMADTYRLLIAQLEWQERADADAARRWLDEVIERDDRHEGAHRLLADIDEEAEEWNDAAEHLRIALSVSGEGLDSLELEKRLARLLLYRLDDPQRALARFEHVLSQAPGDAAVLEGIRASQAAMGDWEGVAESLREELRLLLGYTRAADPEADWVTEIDPSTVASPLRMPASQVLADLARITEEELDDPERAHLLWGFVVDLFPEHAEALERRIDLDRMLEDHDALVADLETYASMLLDWHARLDALLECARIRGEKMGDWSGARELLKRTLQQVEELAEAPSNVDEARETLHTWAEQQG